MKAEWIEEIYSLIYPKVEVAGTFYIQLKRNVWFTTVPWNFNLINGGRKRHFQTLKVLARSPLFLTSKKYACQCCRETTNKKKQLRKLINIIYTFKDTIVNSHEGSFEITISVPLKLNLLYITLARANTVGGARGKCPHIELRAITQFWNWM